MTRDDDALLQGLASALEPDDVEPSPARVAALRHQAAAHQPAPAHPGRSRVLVGLAVGLVAVVAFGVGAVVGDRVPDPMRGPAHDLGLPVRSPALVEAEDQLDNLAQALAVDDLGAARAADDAMLAAVADLDEDERADILPVAHEVHQRYLEHLSEQFEP